MTRPRRPSQLGLADFGALTQPLQTLAPRPTGVKMGSYLQPLDAIAHTGVERQGEEQSLADLRPRPHGRARPAGAAPKSAACRPPPPVLRARRLRARRAGRGLGRRAGREAFYSNYKGGVRPGRPASALSLYRPRPAGVRLGLGETGTRPRACRPERIRAGPPRKDGMQEPAEDRKARRRARPAQPERGQTDEATPKREERGS